MVSRKGEDFAQNWARSIDATIELLRQPKVPALEFPQREAQTAWDEIHQRLDEYNIQTGREGPHRA